MVMSNEYQAFWPSFGPLWTPARGGACDGVQILSASRESAKCPKGTLGVYHFQITPSFKGGKRALSSQKRLNGLLSSFWLLLLLLGPLGTVLPCFLDGRLVSLVP